MGSMVLNPIAFFTDTQGDPLQGGNVYVGVANTNPVTNPVPVYQDSAMTIPMQQPLKTSGGYVSLNGAPQPIYTNAASYSLMATDSVGNMTLSIPNYTNSLANQVGVGGASQIGFDGTTLDQVLKLRLNRVVDSINALRSLSSVLYSRAFVTGYYAPHDGGGGAYQYDPSDTTSADNGGSIIVALDGARWKLQFVDEVNVAQFGAKADGTTDDTTAFVNAITFMNGRGGGVVRTSFNGQSVVGSNLTAMASVILKGLREGTGSPGTNASANYAAVSGAIILSSSATISVAANASLSGMLIYRQGMVFPTPDASAFAGTAVTITGDDATVERMLILGFNKAIYSNGPSRQRFQYVYGDCNNGIEITNCTDVPHVDDCEFWPYATIATSSSTGSYTILQRPGTAFSFHDTVDGAKVKGCFAYGYQRGFLVNNANSTTFVDCWADGTFGPGVLNTGNIAFQIAGSSQDTKIIGWGASAQAVAGIQINTNAGCLTTITGGNAWFNTADGIAVLQGDVIILGNGIRDSNNGITFYGGSNAVIDDCKFNDIAGLPINTGVSTSSIRIGTNDYGNLAAGQPPVGNAVVALGVTVSSNVANLPATIPQELVALYGGGNLSTMNGGYTGRRLTLAYQATTTLIHTAFGGALNSIVCKSGANETKAAGAVSDFVYVSGQWIEK